MATASTLTAPVLPEVAHTEAMVSLNTDLVIAGVQYRLTMRDGATAETTLALLREAYRATTELRKAGAAFVLNRDARETFNGQAVTIPNGNGHSPAPVNGSAQPVAPVNGYGNVQPAAPNGNGNGVAPDPAWCPIHGCAMRRFEKGTQAWYSHKADDGTWCRGKAKK